MIPQIPSLAQEFEAALAWWHMAGVDHDFADDATTWLAPTAPAAGSAPDRLAPAQRAQQPAPASTATQDSAPRALAPAAAPEAQRHDYLGDSPPADLAAFRQWWMEAPGLAPSPAFPRLAPRGDAGAALMVLVPQPEAEDREVLLSGPQGRLLTNILAAMGLEESAVYIAAALPAHTPMADLSALAASGMDAVTAHHVALVAPQRLIAFGTGLAPMLSATGDQSLGEINYRACKVAAIASETLDALMNMPRLKGRFWRRWMEWSATH
jgi:DNA polymerase